MTDKVKQQMHWLGWLMAAISAAFSTGYAARGDWGELPKRVAAIEHWRATSVDPALRYLVCSQQATNNGQDPARCDVLLKDLPELLGRSQ